MKKALVLSSGGVDSTTCLAMAVSEYGSSNVIALSVIYGQKHSKETEAAKKVADYYHVKFIEIDLTAVFADSNCSLLSHSTEEIPEESYDSQLKKTDGKPVSTYVPFRNGLFLSCAASIALSEGCSEVWYGAHMDDAAGSAYPDCSQAFADAMNTAIWEGSGRQVKQLRSLPRTRPVLSKRAWNLAFLMNLHGAAMRAATAHAENAVPALTAGKLLRPMA